MLRRFAHASTLLFAVPLVYAQPQQQIPLRIDHPPLSSSSSSSSSLQAGDHPLQEGALPVPTRPLPWGTLNILSTTDTHGWLRGHTHSDHIPESLYSASIADLADFHTHLSRHADELGVDLLFVDSGDTVDGNGFVDADTSGVKGKAARQLLKQVGYDLFTTGNHELYNYTVALDVYKDYIPSFSGHYLASNVNITLPSAQSHASGESAASVPYGERVLRFQTKNQKLHITAFGVLFDFDRADKGITVQSPAKLVQETWWKQELESARPTDVFVLVGHMATYDKDWLAIVNSIRLYHPTTPILIYSGHAHVRDCIRPDPYSQVLASGRYMETIGFSSITLPSRHNNGVMTDKIHPLYTSLTAAQAANPLQIERRYLDANLATYYYHSRTSSRSFSTAKGERIQNQMEDYANSFNLSFTFGEAPQSYYLNRYPMTHHKSLIKLYADEVFNTVLGNKNAKSGQLPSIQPAFLFNTGGARFDIFKGPFTRDDQFTVIPFENGLWNVAIPLEYDLVLAVVEWLNSLTGEPELLVSKVYPAALSSQATPSISSAAWLDSMTVKIDDDWLRQAHQILTDSLDATRKRNGEAARSASIYDSEDDSEDSDYEASARLAAASENIGERGRSNRLGATKHKEKATFGYVTHDSCSGYGDDIRHRPLPAYAIPEFVLSTRPSHPHHDDQASDNSEASTASVHLVFYEFIAPLVISALNEVQSSHVFSYDNITIYSPLKANELLGVYATMKW